MVTIVVSVALAASLAAKPNFVLILVDDLGYNNIGCFGSQDIQTPNLDRLAAEGMKFTQIYATSPICSPTRASLVTGRYPSRMGLGTPLHTTDKTGLPAEEVTIAEVLKRQGYKTACIGKWHLGHLPEYYPTQHGFDHYYGTPLGHCFASEAKRRDGQVSDLYLRNETPITFPKFANLTNDLTKEAVRWIRQDHSQPFFLFLSMPMPHTPLAATARFQGKSAGGLYGDVCEELDWGIGEVLKALVEQGLEENTLVAFTSDNGAHLEKHNAPFRGRKQQPLEGGIRVPCIIKWPGRIPNGTECKELATVMDFLPTFASLAGTCPDRFAKLDGHDIQPLLQGKPGATTPYESFVYHARFGKRAGIRMGKWKLLVECDARTWVQKGSSLYDLENDPRETRNVLEQNPQIAELLITRLETFEDSLP